MRLLMLNNEFPPLGGGTATVNQALLKRFGENRELEIDLITSAIGKEKERENVSPQITIHKVPVRNRCIHHSSNRELITYATLSLRMAYQLHKKRPYDLCFAWSALPAGAVALVLSKVLGLPYIVRVCGPDIPGFERRYQTLCRFVSPIILRVWREADAVVAKCKAESERIRSLDDSIGVSIIANGVDTGDFVPSVARDWDGPLRILCVGRLIERKGQDKLLQAVRMLKDDNIEVTLELIGTGDSEGDYRKQVTDLGIESNVIFSGYIARSEIAKHYSVADVFALASDNEGMSISSLEAMASGLPLLVSRSSGMDELVEEGLNGFTFHASDLEGLTAYLKEFSSHPEKVGEMGAQSRRKAKEFSWESVAEAYLSLFKDLGVI